MKKNKLPKFLQSALWSYELKKLNIKKDKNLIITQILNHGTWKQLKWLQDNYSFSEIRTVLRTSGRGAWYEDVLNYWSIILNLRLSKNRIGEALVSLRPKPYAFRNTRF